LDWKLHWKLLDSMVREHPPLDLELNSPELPELEDSVEEAGHPR
jgi:hypothetical protein